MMGWKGARLLRRVGGLLCALLLGAAGAAHGYVFTTLDLPGSTDSQGFDVNNAGVFVGTATVGGEIVGYLYNGAFNPLSGPAGSVGTGALGISDGGVVVGSYYTVTNGPQAGYILEGGVYTPFSYPGAIETFLRGISPNGRYVTGYADDGATRSAFVYDRTLGNITLITSATGGSAIAQGVTDAGLVVGNRLLAGVNEAFTYNLVTNTLTFSQIAPGIATAYRGISETGLIDGFYTDAGVTHGLLGSASPFATVDYPGTTTTFLEGINDDAWLAGYYTDARGVGHAFLATVPEPPALALMLVGLTMLALRRRR